MRAGLQRLQRGREPGYPPLARVRELREDRRPRASQPSTRREETTMMKRRSIIESTATLGIGALAGCALPGTAAQAPKTPFMVTDTYIPIVGSDLQYPVRRIYCIGRNYAAHAREMGSDPTREPP